MAEKTDNVQYLLIKHRTDMHTNNIFPASIIIDLIFTHYIESVQ
jgi:hypothetical protein